MENQAPEEVWLTLNEETNALEYLERAASFIREAPENVRAWKWVVISLHGALYGFAVSASQGTNYENVLSKKGKLLGIWDVLKMCQDPDHMKMLIHSKHLQLTERQRESISDMTTLLRNRFEHFVPTTWAIEIHGLPQMSMNVLEVIRFLALETGTSINMKEKEQAMVDGLVRESIAFIKGTGLYAEAIRGEELYKKENPK
jgi:hypothetical protein